MEPKWLLWAHELQDITHVGLVFATDVYDCRRYERLRQLAAQMMVEHSGVESSRVEGVFSEQVGPRADQGRASPAPYPYVRSSTNYRPAPGAPLNIRLCARSGTR